jgi:hypothetical protein
MRYRAATFTIVTDGILLSRWQNYARNTAYYLPPSQFFSIACALAAGCDHLSFYKMMLNSLKHKHVNNDVFWTLTDQNLGKYNAHTV